MMFTPPKPPTDLIGLKFGGLHWVGSDRRTVRPLETRMIELSRMPYERLRPAYVAYLRAAIPKASDDSTELQLRMIDLSVLSRLKYGDYLGSVKGVWFGPDVVFQGTRVWTWSPKGPRLGLPVFPLMYSMPGYNSLAELDALHRASGRRRAVCVGRRSRGR